MKVYGKIVAALATTSIMISACGKSEDKESKGSTEAPAAAAKTAEVVPEMKATPIPSMSVELEVPADSLVDDNTATAGFPSGTLYANPTIFLSGEAEGFSLKDMAAQKAEVEKNPGNKFKSFTKEEALEGGYHLEYELSSMMDEKETLYGFHIQTTIDGKKIDCSSNTQNPEELARGVAMCKTLRATK